jgi:hypothetical protein
MARAATQANQDANSQYQNWEQSALNNYNQAMGGFNTNLDNMLSQGNPYQSKSYLENQNKLTSAAMNSQNTAAKQNLQDTALRTGENTAAIQNTIASNARAGQRTLDTYNAQRDTENQDKYLQYEQQLLQDQLAGANSEAGIYGTNVSGRSDALNNLTSIQNAQQQMWGNIIGGVAGGAGSVFQGKG